MGPYEQQLNASRKEIRRLVLQPLSAGPEVQCSTETVSLLDEPEYEALSYVWGDASIRKDIIFDGREFSVTSNLAVALHHLRFPDKPRRLWVDALCINQNDMKERNEQVSMMGDVYVGARPVVIWLGEGSEETEEGFDLIATVANGEEMTDFTRQTLFSFYFEFVKRPWFHRLWTVQELVLANQDPLVGCGFKWTVWSTLVKTWQKVALIGFEKMGMVLPKKTGGIGWETGEISSVRPNGIRIDMLQNLRKAVAENGGEGVRSLLLNTNMADATEPKDRVYGLLGMMQKEDRECFIVDYGKPLDVVYAEAIALVFREGQGPYTISGMQLAGSLLDPEFHALYPSFPSWVPMFGNKGLASSTRFHPPGIGASGAGSNAINGEIDTDLKTLRIRGLPIDTIVDTFAFGQEDICLTQLTQVEALVEKAHQLAASNANHRPYLARYKCKEQVWRTLITNKKYTGATREAAPESYAELYDILLRSQNSNSSKKKEDEDPARDYRLSLLNHLPSHYFFVTATGFYGIGQSSIEIGDDLAIWFGSPVPFALRPTSAKDENDRPIYTVSAVAYVAGIMDGEMVDEVYCEDLEDDVVFTVR